MQIISTISDLGFKTVFGERPHLLMSLLNNFLPLAHPIVEVHYLNSEIIPEKKDGKNGIVDVRCKDSEKAEIPTGTGGLFPEFIGPPH